MNNAANVIRICEREVNFEVVIIDSVRTYNQGPALGAKSVAEARAWAERMLPSRCLEGATWEYRSKDGVYSRI